MSNRSLGVGLIFLLAPLGGCVAASEPEPDVQLIGESAEAIAGGYDDATDTAVVGILADFGSWGQAICSGSLLAPNVVLTARHCVSNLVNDYMGGVICAQTGFTGSVGPENVFVTTKQEMPYTLNGYHAVREIVMLPTEDMLVCGNDQVILILNELIDPSEAVPLVPRVDVPLGVGEQYYAVGYGAVNDNFDGAGFRRRRDNLFVECVAEGCPVTTVKQTEWVGDTGICSGDSGGPALDLLNRVLGVTSRGNSGCSNPVYGYVLGWGQWIKDTTVYAAGLGAYDPPPWATGFPTDPVYTAPVGDSCSAADQCATNACLDDYCTRPCTDIATCPDGYSCKGEPGFCEKNPKPKSDEADGGKASCAIRATPDPTTPIPWFSGLALGALALLRRARRGRAGR